MKETVRPVQAAGGEIVAVQRDARDQADVDAALQEGLESFGGVDIVLANAGTIHDYNNTWLIDDDSFRNIVDVNLVGVWHTRRQPCPWRQAAPAS